MSRPHYKLEVWNDAIELVAQIYQISESFPADEKFGLTSQIRRAAVSVPSNIAEGAARTTKDYMRFLTIARGSLSEVETQLVIAHRLGYFSGADELKEQLNKVFAKLNALISSLGKHQK